MTEKSNVQRQYRDRLFKFIFGRSENRKWTLSLYNAINGSNHTNEEDIQLSTIENVLYLGMRNDVAFLIDDNFSFYEQQSTINLNMPVRYLIYAGMAYSGLIEDREIHIYGSKQQNLPVPKCVCFYNGADETEDRFVLSLSNAFGGRSDSDIDVRVTMININRGHNKELLDACEPLKEYGWFGDTVRTCQKNGKSLEEAIDTALKEMPGNFVIKPFLLTNRAEVKHMILTEYDEKKVLRGAWKEGREEGLAEGRAEGRAEERIILLLDLLEEGILSLDQAAEKANMTVSEFEERAAQLKKRTDNDFSHA